MMRYFFRGEINYAIIIGEVKSLNDFTEQVFTGELFGVDSARVLRQDVFLVHQFLQHMF